MAADIMTGLAEGLINFADWGIGILALIVVWEFFQLIKGGTKSGNASGETGLTNWNKSPILNLKRRWEKRGMNKVLNEHIKDEAELKLVDEVVAKVKEAGAAVSRVESSKVLDLTGRDKVVRYCKEGGEISNKLDAAVKGIKTIMRKQGWRAYRDTKNFIEKLEQAGVDVSRAKTLENDILRKHKEAHDHLVSAKSVLASAVGSNLNAVETFPLPNLPVKLAGKTKVVKALSDAITNLGKALNDTKKDTLLAHLIATDGLLKAVMQDVQGLIVESRELLKKNGEPNTAD